MEQEDKTSYQLAELFFRLLQNLSNGSGLRAASEKDQLYQLASQSPRPSEVILVSQVDGQVYVLLRTEAQEVPEIEDQTKGLSPRRIRNRAPDCQGVAQQSDRRCARDQPVDGRHPSPAHFL